MNAYKAVAGLVGTLIAAEGAMLAYTWIVPDLYKDYTVASCKHNKVNSVKITAIGKDSDGTYRQRTFSSSPALTGLRGIVCTSTPPQEAVISDKSLTCSFSTKGQYIPQIGMWPIANGRQTTCSPTTPEQLQDIKSAIENGQVTDNFVVRLMK